MLSEASLRWSLVDRRRLGTDWTAGGLSSVAFECLALLRLLEGRLSSLVVRSSSTSEGSDELGSEDDAAAISAARAARGDLISKET